MGGVGGHREEALEWKILRCGGSKKKKTFLRDMDILWNHTTKVFLKLSNM